MKLLQKYSAYFFPSLIVFLVIFYLRNILFPNTNQIAFGGDLLTQFYFWKGYLVESLRSGTIPFWNPYLFSGIPFLAHPSTAFFYPATLLYMLLPLNLSFSIVYFIHLVIAGWGTYILTRKYADKFSAFWAGTLCVFSGYFASRIYAGHVDLLTTSVWIPWVIISFKEITDVFTFKNMLKALLFLSMMILAGYMAYVVFTMEFVAFFVVFNMIRTKLWKHPKSIFGLVLPIFTVIILSLGITASQWLPTWQLTRESIRGKGLPYELASWGSLPITSLKLFFDPFDKTQLNKISYGLLGGKAPNAFDHYSGGFPVILIIIFGFISLISYKTNLKFRKMFLLPVDFWLYLIFLIYSSLIAFGNNLTPNFHAILYNITPFYKYIRIPIQHLVFPVFLIPVMAGMVLSKFKNDSIKLIIGIACLFQLFTYGNQYIYLTQVPDVGYDKNLIKILSKQDELTRVLPNFRVVSPVLIAMDFNATSKYKIQSTGGYDPVILNSYYYLIDVLNGNKKSSIYSYNVEIPPLKFSPEIFNHLNIRYILNEKWNDQEFQNKYKKLLDNSLYSLYENKTFLPRFYLVNGIEDWSGSPYPDMLSSVMQREKILVNTKKYNINKELTDCFDNSSGYIQVITYEPNRIILNVSTKCDTLLTGIENNYPGWRAKIDKVNTKIITGNFTQRTILVPKGVHTIEFYYQPIIYLIGILISVISGLICLLVYLKYNHSNKFIMLKK